MISSPDIRELWTRIEGVLRQHVPDTARTLAVPATDQEINELEEAIGLKLPADFRESLGIHDGQDDPTRCHSFCSDGVLAGTKKIAETWRMLTEIDGEILQKYYSHLEPDGHGAWWNRHWVPFTDAEGDCLCINLNPELRPGAAFGEIVAFVHDNPHEPGIAPSYGVWLQKLAQRLEDGDFEINEYGYLRLNIDLEK